MAFPFISSIDLRQKQIIRGVWHNATANPAGVEGQFYYNTANNDPRMYINGAWRSLLFSGSSNTNYVSDVIAGTDITVSQNGNDFTVNHADTGPATALPNNINSTVIQNISVDDRGHVTAVEVVDLTNNLDNYNNWVVATAGHNGQIHSGDTLTFLGGGAIQCDYDSLTKELTIQELYTASLGITKFVSGSTYDLRLSPGRARALHLSSTDGITIGNGADLEFRTITGSTYINVSNGNGVAGNPTISLDTGALNTYLGNNVDRFTVIEANTGSYSAGSNSDKLFIKGGDGIVTAVTENPLGTAEVEVEVANDVVRTFGNQTIGGNKTFTGDTVFQGDVTISGQYTLTEPTIVKTQDNILFLNSDYGNIAPADDSGFLINRGSSDNVGLIFDESADEFVVGYSATDPNATTGAGTVIVNAHADFRAGKYFTENTVQYSGGGEYNKVLILDGTEVKYRSLTELRNDMGAGTGNGTVTVVNFSNSTDGVTTTVVNGNTNPTLTVNIQSASVGPTSSQGLVSLANAAETLAGTNNTKALTPDVLHETYALFSVGSATPGTQNFTLTHNLGSQMVSLTLRHNTTHEEFMVANVAVDNNTLELNFDEAVALDTFTAKVSLL